MRSSKQMTLDSLDDSTGVTAHIPQGFFEKQSN